MNGVRVSERTLAYDRNNPIYAVGKRGYKIATATNARGAAFINRYNRVMNVVGRMQERMQSVKGNSNG